METRGDHDKLTKMEIVWKRENNKMETRGRDKNLTEPDFVARWKKDGKPRIIANEGFFGSDYALIVFNFLSR